MVYVKSGAKRSIHLYKAGFSRAAWSVQRAWMEEKPVDMTYHSYRTRSSKPSMCFWPECHLVVAKFYDVCCLFKEKITWHLMSGDINSPTCWLVMVNFLDILEWKRCTIIKCSVLNWRLLSIVDCFFHADLYKKEIR